MKSPFPGMDPYLEQYWGDVHTSLATYTRDQLNRVLPADLRARVVESLTVDLEESPAPGSPQTYFPDVQVRTARGRRAIEPARGAVSAAEPIRVVRRSEPQTRRAVRILSGAGSVVTAIEILSPSNKIGRTGRAEYAEKQSDLLRSGVNLVELDLLRCGRHVLAFDYDRLGVSDRTPYMAAVVRARKKGRAEVYPISIRARLPAIRIPLRKSDDDVPLDLQSLIDAAYENGGYDSIDYTVPPDPILSPADAAWADKLLKAAGKR